MQKVSLEEDVFNVRPVCNHINTPLLYLQLLYLFRLQGVVLDAWNLATT